MSEITIGENTYRVGRMNARQQLHVARRLASTPISVILGASTDGAVADEVRDRAQQSGFSAEEIKNTLPRLLPSLSLRSLGMLSDADCDFVVNNCMNVCQRKSAGSWANVWNAASGQLMFQDIELEQMLELTVAVLRENLGNFFGATPLASMSSPTTGTPTSTG